jgi:hypothetical protein
MNKPFRKLAIKKISKKINKIAASGPLSSLVDTDIEVKKNEKNYQTIGTAGPGTSVVASKTAVKSDGTVDVAIVFRGTSGADAAKLGIDGVLVSAEAVGPQSQNMGSKLLEKQYGSAEKVNEIVDSVLAQLQKQHPDKHIKMGKLVVAGFSGGCGVLNRVMIERDKLKYRNNLSAVLYDDGGHTPKNSAAIDAMVEWAKECEIDPSKQFKFLHTAVIPVGYNSTTEVADNLVQRLGLTREQSTEYARYGFIPESVARSGGVEVIQMYNEATPYFVDNRAGSMGDQHVKAVTLGLPALFHKLPGSSQPSVRPDERVA